MGIQNIETIASVRLVSQSAVTHVAILPRHPHELPLVSDLVESLVIPHFFFFGLMLLVNRNSHISMNVTAITMTHAANIQAFQHLVDNLTKSELSFHTETITIKHQQPRK